jgi:hypothetical protein
VARGNNWFGSDPSIELEMQPGAVGEQELAERFIRDAFQLYGQ